MSTSAQISPAWKEEVNRRLAEHRGRKGAAPAEQRSPAEAQPSANRRAQEAAARVAARYKNAPSYSEVLASEARAALRAAEAASEAALQARAAAESVLAGIEAAAGATPPPEPMRVLANPRQSFSDDFFTAMPESPLEPAFEPAFTGTAAIVEPEPEPALAAPVILDQPVSIRWDAELTARATDPADLRAGRGQNPMHAHSQDWWRPVASEPELAAPEPIEIVEPAQPIPANLIEFPRELVAARKARPRLSESPEPEPQMQLSIFEVDPFSISTDPEIATAAESAPEWSGPAWSGMEFAAHPQIETSEPIVARVEESYEILEEPSLAEVAAPAIEPAPLSLRLMALVVDGALIAGSLLAAAYMVASRARVLPGVRATEIGIGIGLLIAVALYETLFFTLGRATPGMRYAKLRLSTFEGHLPTRAQRCGRLIALLVSVLPAGLGVAWSLFDEDHLSWHDRLSRTYICKR